MRNLMILSSLGLALGMSATAGAQDYRQGNRYDDRDNRPQVIRCESSDNRRRDCQVDARGGVQLVRQHSDAACIEGRTWGADARGIWVDRGCRAEFAVGGGRAYGNTAARTFRCESTDRRQQQCPVDGRGRVTLVRQLSDTRCIEGRNWGQDGRGVWVDGGCRAEFQVSGGGRADWNRGRR